MTWQMPRGMGPLMRLVPLLVDRFGFNYQYRYAGAEIAYMERATDITDPTGTHILATPYGDPFYDIVLNGRQRILLEAGLPRTRMVTSGSFSLKFFAIERDSAGTQTDYGEHAATSQSGNTEEKSIMIRQFVTPTAGQYRFTVQWNYNGTCTHYGTQSPAWLRVSVAG